MPSTLYGSRGGAVRDRRLVVLVAVSGVALGVMAFAAGPYIQIGFGSPALFLLGFVRVSYPFWAGVLLFRNFASVGFAGLPIVGVGAALVLLLLAPITSPFYILFMEAIAFPVVLVCGASVRALAREPRACRALGELSYPLYLVHVPILVLSNRIAAGMPYWQPSLGGHGGWNGAVGVRR